MNVGIASIAQSLATCCRTQKKTDFIEQRKKEKEKRKEIEVFDQTFSSSTSTLTKMTWGSFLASSAKMGATKRQGPHHEAVKSTTICVM